MAAENRAKEAKRGVWIGWDPSLDAAPTETSSEPENGTHERKLDYREVLITNVEEDGKLKLQ